MEAGVMDELWKPHFSEERWGFLAFSNVGKQKGELF
jgi:hypothetical protein